MPSAATALNAAVSYIESRLGEPLRLDEVAGAAHYSKYHLNRLFSSEVGTSLHDYIVRRRLTAAARLLIEGESMRRIQEELDLSQVPPPKRLTHTIEILANA